MIRAVAAFVAALTATIAWSASECTRPISCGATLARTLDLSVSCLDSQAKTYDLFTIFRSVNDRVTFTASSPSFSPQLILLDPLNVQRASNLNTSSSAATLQYTIPQSGTWTLMMRNATVSGDGPYSLSLACSTDAPPPPPQPDSGFILTPSPGAFTLGRSQSATMRVTSTPVGSFIAAVAISIAAPSVVSVTPSGFQFQAPGSGAMDVQIMSASDAVSGHYAILITGTATSGETAAVTVSLRIDAPCSTPTIAAQPQPTSTPRGTSARLTVRAGGTPPFSYQWYRGRAPSTTFPVGFATSSDLVTPPITEDTEFWVRIQNECGTRDSFSAMVKMTAPLPRRRAIRR